KKERPKIIFLDIKLPDKSGLDLLKEFKEIDPECIVIMITALEDKDKTIEEKARELGASEFIHKPFSRNYLRDEVVVGKIKTVLEQGGHMQRPRLLLVDDEPDIPPALKKYFASRIEADIDLAYSGEEAIKQVNEYKPDVILLDVRMPGKSGLDILSEIRESCPEARVVLISAWSSSEVASKAAEFGVKDYI
ncbi:MAG: response regulator, partial [Candidatus Omnitrophica bacterium]|nr:response regulator [Candidatus Omnitrophota bacterium]